MNGQIQEQVSKTQVAEISLAPLPGEVIGQVHDDVLFATASPRPAKPEIPEAERFRRKFRRMTDRQLLGEVKRKAKHAPNLLGAAFCTIFKIQMQGKVDGNPLYRTRHHKISNQKG